MVDNDINDFNDFVKSESVSISLLRILRKDLVGFTQEEEKEYFKIIDNEINNRLKNKIEGF